ncbi:hypothetical protein LCGC14_0732960 [marine sediment metagenome]|uniref:Uncharacterized protein n=1 Tax=marine sediment metagenome TaxID=412755 RepID=A0A0F9QU33_9ZZZZ
MNTWFKLLPLEIQEVEALIEPTEEIREGDTVVGVASDELKKLWTLSRAAKKEAELLQVELKYTQASGEERAKISELMAKSRAMEMIFWIGAMDELQLWGHADQCAMRVGWQVVEFKQPECRFPFQIFGSPE